LFLFVLAFSAFSQTPQQKEYLIQLSSELEADYHKSWHVAKKKADSLGIPLRIETPEGVMELQAFERGMPVYYTTYNYQGAVAINSSQVWPGGNAGLNLTGQGQTLGMWDGGATRLTHQEFGDRVVQADGASALSNHATHVAATMVGGGYQQDAKGMSYLANLDAYDWNNDVSEMAEAAAEGLRVSQHSYGFTAGWRWDDGDWYWHGDLSISTEEDYKFGFYDDIARTWDLIANNAPGYLIVKSAGNDRGRGPEPGTGHYVWSEGGWTWSTDVRQLDGGEDGFDCISRNGNAKNILTVGAVTAQGVMSDFSGWGPTDDGRIKPDIVAKGVGVYSATAASDFAYDTWNGTSMSGPMVSGSVGLLLEHYQNLHGPFSSLRSASMKGLILHTADETGSHPAPDYSYGWGMMNTQSAAELISHDALAGGDFNIRELTLENDQTVELEVVSDGTAPLKATIVWNDPAASPLPPALNPTTPMLVNDLDLRIYDESDTAYFPWILDPANPAETATTGDNFRDNVEQVFIENPVEGETYTITVSHKGTLSDSQEFSLIVNGIHWEDLNKQVTFTVSNEAGQPLENARITIDPQSEKKYDSLQLPKSGNSSSREADVPAKEWLSSLARGFEMELQNKDSDDFVKSPPGIENKSGYWLHWDTGVNEGSIGIGNGGIFYVAARWQPDELQAFQGMLISKLRVYISDLPTNVTAKIWQGMNEYSLQEMVSKSFVPAETSWNEVYFDQAYPVNVEEELWIGLEIDDPGDDLYPMGRDNATLHDGKGNKVKIGHDGDWDNLSGYDIAGNWNLQAFLEESQESVLFTDANGQAAFLSTGGTYNYMIEKDGYLTYEGTFSVTENDLDIDVILQYDENPPERYLLELVGEPEPAGTLSGAGEYEQGTLVDVGALAADGYEFSHWTDIHENTISAQANFEYAMPASDMVLTAHFQPTMHTLEIDTQGGGEVLVDDSVYDGVVAFEYGSQVILKAMADPGWRFDSWSGDIMSDSLEETLLIDQDKSVTAHFSELPLFELKLMANPAYAGATEGEGLYYEGQEVVVEAIAHQGYIFQQWSDVYNNEVAGQSEYTFDMPANELTLVAHFYTETFTQEQSAEEINMFPNPARGYIVVISDMEIQQVMIKDITGREILAERVTGKSIRIELAGVHPGVYMVTLKTMYGPVVKKLQILGRD